MAKILRIAICDDEDLQIELLTKYVRNWEKLNHQKVVIESYHNGSEFHFTWSGDDSFDILLLDIEMPNLNGIELARKIREKDENLQIIFITGVADFIGEGYDLQAVNYLLKPIKEEKLYDCLDTAVRKLPNEEQWLVIEQEDEIIRLNQSEILYIEAFSHTIDIHTKNGKYTIRKSISAIEKELVASLFVRCHRSYLISLLHIDKILKDEILLDGGDSVPLSRRRYKEVNMAFINYFKGNGGV